MYSPIEFYHNFYNKFLSVETNCFDDRNGFQTTRSKFDATGFENPEKSLNSKKIPGLESP